MITSTARSRCNTYNLLEYWAAITSPDFFRKYGDFMARKTGRKLTPNQRAYQKEIKRLQAGLLRAQRQKGYLYNPDLIPKMPRRVTKKSLEQIRSIKPRQLYEQEIKYTRGVTQKEVKQLGLDRIISSGDFSADLVYKFIDSFSQFGDKIYNKMSSWMEGLMRDYTVDQLITMIIECPYQLVEFLYNPKYPSDQAVKEYQLKLINYIPNLSERGRSELSDLLEAPQWEL